MANKLAVKFDNSNNQMLAGDMNEEILSDSDVDSRETDSDVDDRIIDDEETAQDRKIRIAKRLIEQIQQQKEEDLNDKQQHAFISRKLEEDLQAKTGKLRKEIAYQYTDGLVENRLKGHRLSVTCVAVSPNMKLLFSGSKDGSIVKWNFETGAKIFTIQKRIANSKDNVRHSKNFNSSQHGHTSEILCLALSDDSKYLASSGRDKSIRIWKPETCEFVYNFEGHRDAVSGLVFRLHTHELYSCSFDRSVKIWNVDQLVYAETLFGHQDMVLGIDSLAKERCVTCGARDRTARVWKIVEESQLVFNGTHFDSIDCICLLNEEFFFTGSNESTLAVWNINKKKPIASVRNAHRFERSQLVVAETASAEEELVRNEIFDQCQPTSWISAVAAYHNTDLLASGSDDGFIRVWSFASHSNSLKEIFKIQINGFVNDLKFSADGNCLVAAVGQEHKLGRWSINKSAKNEIVVIKFQISNAPVAHVNEEEAVAKENSEQNRFKQNKNNKKIKI